MSVIIDITKAIRMYRDDSLSSTVVAKAVGCSVQTLINRLRDNNVIIRSNGYWNQKIKFEDIKNEYESGMSLTEIANKHNMNAVSIWERLKNGGVQLRDRKKEAKKKCQKIPDEKFNDICQRYLNKENAAEIARDYDVHKTTICDILRKCGIEIERVEGERVKHLYKGGITALHTRIRHCEKGRQWIKNCMERDDYTCQHTNQKGGKLHVHHKTRFSKIFQDFLLI